MRSDLVGSVDTKRRAAQVCRALAAHYGATLRYGPDAAGVQVVAAALDAIGVADRETFLGNCAITVGDGIYVPFRWGPSPWTPAQKVALVAHECQHVRQGGDAHLLFWLRYFTSQPHRAEFEVAALAVEMEVTYRLTGRMLDPSALAEHLAWYRVGAANQRIAAKHLTVVADTLARGATVSDQMRVIEQIMRKGN